MQHLYRTFCSVEDFTLKEVADRAGVAVRTVLRAYPSQDELIYAALGEMAAGGVFLKPDAARRCRPRQSPHFSTFMRGIRRSECLQAAG